MAKYHINPETGNPGVCKATISCRFGDADKHFDSKDDARKAYEVEQQALTVPLKPQFEYDTIRFGKLTSKDDIAKLGAALRNEWQIQPHKRFKVRDRYGFGLGVYSIAYDGQKGEFVFQENKYRVARPISSSKDLNELLGEVADQVGYADYEYEQIDWDQD